MKDKNTKQTINEREVGAIILETKEMIKAFDKEHAKYTFEKFKKDVCELDSIASNIIAIVNCLDDEAKIHADLHKKVKALEKHMKDCERFKQGAIGIFSWNGNPREDRQEIRYRIVVSEYKSLIDACMKDIQQSNVY